MNKEERQFSEEVENFANRWALRQSRSYYSFIVGLICFFEREREKRVEEERIDG